MIPLCLAFGPLSAVLVSSWVCEACPFGFGKGPRLEGQSLALQFAGHPGEDAAPVVHVFH